MHNITGLRIYITTQNADASVITMWKSYKQHKTRRYKPRQLRNAQVRHFQVLHFQALRLGPSFSGLAFSGPAFSVAPVSVGAAERRRRREATPEAGMS